MKFNENRFLALHFEMTNKCNLRCKHCYNIDYLTSNNFDLTTEDAKKIIDKSIEIGCKDIGFSGGEPFARNDIIDLIKYCSEYPIHILTNGLLINDNIISELNNIENLVLEFRISLDGLESHNVLRNVSYKNVLEVIKKLLANDYVVTVNTMITDNNIDELILMYNQLNEIGVDRWRLDFIFNSGNAANNNLVISQRQKLFYTLKELIKLYIKENPEMILDINKVFRSSFLDGYEPFDYTLDSKPCEYQGSLTVRPNGDISFCPSLNKTFGNILNDSIENIVNNEEWIKFSNIKVKDLNPKCHKCKYLKVCGGGCRADAYYEKNDIYEISDFNCELIEFFVEEVLPLIDEYKNSKEL